MLQQDASGLPLSGASPRAAELYREAARQFHALHGTPYALVSQAIADSPDFVMAHALKANMLVGGTNPALTAMGVAAIRTAEALPATSREQGHVAALARQAEGELRAAGRILEDVAIDHPRDVLALQAGQNIDFLLGDARMLRDRIARALPAWTADMPHYHAVLGLHAFGLEESGHYARAERAGREAIGLEPTNAWAHHAVAHVMEMQDRRADGVAWMTRESTGWREDSLLGVHNWWHLSLFHLGLGDLDAALAIYDGPLVEAGPDLAFDLVDAAALLWRLQLRGMDLGDRFERLADWYEPRTDLGRSAFEDLHAMLAFVGAGRFASARRVLDAQTPEGPGDNAAMVREAGLPVMQALLDFGEGRHGAAVDGLRRVRNRTFQFGGSHAQRDVVDLTLIAAAERAGELSLLRALAAERANAIPVSVA